MFGLIGLICIKAILGPLIFNIDLNVCRLQTGHQLVAKLCNKVVGSTSFTIIHQYNNIILWYYLKQMFHFQYNATETAEISFFSDFHKF